MIEPAGNGLISADPVAPKPKQVSSIFASDNTRERDDKPVPQVHSASYIVNTRRRRPFTAILHIGGNRKRKRFVLHCSNLALFLWSGRSRPSPLDAPFPTSYAGEQGRISHRRRSFPALSITVQSLAGALVYVVTAGAAFRAATVAARAQRPRGERNYWIAVCAMFVALAIVRLTNLDHGLQDFLRHVAADDHEYDSRGDWQRPLSALLVVLITLAGFAFALIARRFASRPRALTLLVSRAAAVLMVIFWVLRLISLHAVDRMLYSGGAFRANYLIDIGLTATILATSLFYVAIITRRRRRR